MIVNILSSEYRKISKNLEVSYGSSTSPFGLCNIGVITKPEEFAGRVCFIAFAEPRSFLNSLLKHMQGAKIFKDNDLIEKYSKRIFNAAEELPLFLKGTELQIKTWNALLLSKPKQNLCYEYIAEQVENPKAVRAVANAIGRNPIAYLVPCHRVLRKSLALGGYRWGTKLKQAILDYEKLN